MTAPLAASYLSDCSVGLLSKAQVDTLRAQLSAAAGEQAATLAGCATRVAARAPGDTTGLDRAMEALHMYGARKAIEEIAAALDRMEAGGYGTCLACAGPIPFEHLVEIPQARFCAACLAPAIPPAERSAGPRLGSVHELTGAPPVPTRPAPHVDQSASYTSEDPRDNPIAR
jgi:RNA polymerase-binding transcription factor DksA